MADNEEMSDDDLFETAQALAAGTATDTQVEAARQEVENNRDN